MSNRGGCQPLIPAACEYKSREKNFAALPSIQLPCKAFIWGILILCGHCTDYVCGWNKNAKFLHLINSRIYVASFWSFHSPPEIHKHLWRREKMSMSRTGWEYIRTTMKPQIRHFRIRGDPKTVSEVG